jgi:hypothetical protein
LLPLILHTLSHYFIHLDTDYDEKKDDLTEAGLGILHDLCFSNMAIWNNSILIVANAHSGLACMSNISYEEILKHVITTVCRLLYVSQSYVMYIRVACFFPSLSVINLLPVTYCHCLLVAGYN